MYVYRVPRILPKVVLVVAFFMTSCNDKLKLFYSYTQKVLIFRVEIFQKIRLGPNREPSREIWKICLPIAGTSRGVCMCPSKCGCMHRNVKT